MTTPHTPAPSPDPLGKTAPAQTGEGDRLSGNWWHPWNGGVCPVEVDAPVEYMLRVSTSKPLGPTPAGTLRWDHGRTPESYLKGNDIIAYRVAS